MTKKCSSKKIETCVSADRITNTNSQIKLRVKSGMRLLQHWTTEDWALPRASPRTSLLARGGGRRRPWGKVKMPALDAYALLRYNNHSRGHIKHPIPRQRTTCNRASLVSLGRLPLHFLTEGEGDNARLSLDLHVGATSVFTTGKARGDLLLPVTYPDGTVGSWTLRLSRSCRCYVAYLLKISKCCGWPPSDILSTYYGRRL